MAERVELAGDVTVYVGDVREALQQMPDASVHCCVTSPPYFGLRDYGITGQIGLEASVEEYVATMVEVFREVRRVLRPDGTVFLNLGDSYFGSGGAHKPEHANPGLSRSAERGGARRAAAYGTSGKAPEDSQGRGCLCENLCGVCRTAYRIGRFHSESQPAPMPISSQREPNPEHRESERGRLPTSGSEPQLVHSEAANQGPAEVSPLATEQTLSVRGSTIRGCVQPLQETRSEASIPGGECLLCGHSLGGSAPESVDRKACPCVSRITLVSTLDHPANTGGNAEIGDSSASRKWGTAYDYSYPDYTTPCHPVQLKPKDLVGIPWRVAFALQADGWYLRSDIIWAKPNPMPESVTDRPTKSHEYLFLLTKSPTYYYDAEAIKEPGTAHINDKRYGPGAGPRDRQAEPWNQGAPYKPHAGFRSLDTTQGRNRRSVWTVATEPTPYAHFATYPPDLIEPCILAGTSPQACEKCGAPWQRVVEKQSKQEQDSWAGAGRQNGCLAGGGHFGRTGQWSVEITTTGWCPTCTCEGNDGSGRCVVLDPFAGSGTTLMVAAMHGRSSIGCELNPAYVQIMRRRLSSAKAQRQLSI